jgi:hypothetical protein
MNGIGSFQSVARTNRRGADQDLAAHRQDGEFDGIAERS